MFWVRCWRASAFWKCGSRLAASSVAPMIRTPPFFGVPAAAAGLAASVGLAAAGASVGLAAAGAAWVGCAAAAGAAGAVVAAGAAGFGASVGLGAAVGGLGGAWPDPPQACSRPPAT